MDQIQAMRIFVRVVEAGTFTRAADSLNLPKATVTKHVQALEERLRVKLLNRTTRRVTVTPDGAAYYDRTVRLLTDLDDIEASMTNARANPRGRLRIDVGTSVAQLLIIPQLAEFHARYPDIQVDLGVSDRTVDLIGDNVDCVIRGGELSDQSLVARRIGNLEFITVAAPAYLERKGTPTHPLEIEEKHASVIYFSPQSGRHYPLEFRRGDESIDITGPYQLSVNESNAYVTSIVAGLGIGQIISWQAQRYLDSGALVQLLPDWTQPLLPVYVVYPPTATSAPRCAPLWTGRPSFFSGKTICNAKPETHSGQLCVASLSLTGTVAWQDQHYSGASGFLAGGTRRGPHPEPGHVPCLYAWRHEHPRDPATRPTGQQARPAAQSPARRDTRSHGRGPGRLLWLG